MVRKKERGVAGSPFGYPDLRHTGGEPRLGLLQLPADLQNIIGDAAYLEQELLLLRLHPSAHVLYALLHVLHFGLAAPQLIG